VSGKVNSIGLSDKIFAAWQQSHIKHGFRSSSFTSYLGPDFIIRPNLHVLLNAQATRVIQTSTSPIAFHSVEFASGPDGALNIKVAYSTDISVAPRQRVSAFKEVIISAGALETPKLLMNSGIGDKEYLASMGIKSLVNSPDVGTNLSVHIAVSLIYNVNSTQTFDEIVMKLSATQLSGTSLSNCGTRLVAVVPWASVTRATMC
jgi:choline dehydrogenase